MWVDLKKDIIFTEYQLKKRLLSYQVIGQDVTNDYNRAIFDNDILIMVLEYESAQRRLGHYILSEGIIAVSEILEIINFDTGEITQEYVPAIIGIDPLPLNIEIPIYDDGNQIGTKLIPNPEIVQDEIERIDAQIIINSADNTILAVIEYRNNNLSLIDNGLNYDPSTQSFDGYAYYIDNMELITVYQVGNKSIINIRNMIQEQNKVACNEFILSFYSIEKQINGLTGTLANGKQEIMIDHILKCRQEENRIFDLLELSSDPISIETPIWPEA